jgi:hypothetical protein
MIAEVRHSSTIEERKMIMATLSGQATTHEEAEKISIACNRGRAVE